MRRNAKHAASSGENAFVCGLSYGSVRVKPPKLLEKAQPGLCDFPALFAGPRFVGLHKERGYGGAVFDRDSARKGKTNKVVLKDLNNCCLRVPGYQLPDAADVLRSDAAGLVTWMQHDESAKCEGVVGHEDGALFQEGPQAAKCAAGDSKTWVAMI